MQKEELPKRAHDLRCTKAAIQRDAMRPNSSISLSITRRPDWFHNMLLSLRVFAEEASAHERRGAIELRLFSSECHYLLQHDCLPNFYVTPQAYLCYHESGRHINVFPYPAPP